MNVKFKMPKFGRQLTGKEWFKELLMTFLGTTISIVLTFGTSALLENREKAAIQRQTAIMSVYDIDEIIRMAKDERKKEAVLSEVTNYLYSHQEELDSVSTDTLRMAIMYLLEDPTVQPEWADDSKEKTFIGNLEVRQNLKYVQFFNNVSECYRLRHKMLGYLENDAVFGHPISDAEYRQFLQQVPLENLEFGGVLSDNDKRELLRQAFKKHSTALYLRYYFGRHELYTSFIESLERLNRENKFIADISEADLEAYVKKNIDKTRPVVAKQLIGTWEKSFEGDSIRIQLNKDHTAIRTTRATNMVDIFVNVEKVYVPITAPSVTRIKGHWELKDDSLTISFDNKTLEVLSFDVDFSNLPKSALEREKDNLDKKKQDLKNMIVQMVQLRDWSLKNKVSFDLSGQILLCEEPAKTPWGTVESKTSQLVKVDTVVHAAANNKK